MSKPYELPGAYGTKRVGWILTFIWKNINKEDIWKCTMDVDFFLVHLLIVYKAICSVLITVLSSNIVSVLYYLG